MNTLRYHPRTRSLLITVAAVIPAMLIGAGLSSPSAQAGYTVTLLEQMSNVVATGSGRIDLTGLSRDNTFSTSAFINSTAPLIITGPPPPGGSVDEYIPITGTGIWGPGFGAAPDASSGNGDLVGVDIHNGDLFVPAGYVSGNTLSDMSTYNNQTFSSLGVAPGTYEYTWGTGANQNFTLQIGPAAVPAPLIDRGLPVVLVLGGLLFGAKLLERMKRHGLHFG